MDWLLYILLTAIVYFVSWIKLKSQIEIERIRVTPLFLSAISFFIVFEYIFLESLFSNILFHLLGLFLSFLYTFSIYIYLKSQKRKIDIIFEKMLRENQGKISVLSFMQATQMNQIDVQIYLNQKLQELRGSCTKTTGNIYYEYSRFNL